MSDEWIIYNCLRKRQFSTSAICQRWIAHHKRKHRKWKLRAYKCPVCKKWHVSSKSK